MLDTIRKFFNAQVGSAPDEGESIRLATAALYAEMMRQDETVEEGERHAARRALQKKFDLSPDEAMELLKLAEAEAREATDYHQFTSLINRQFTPEQKRRVIEHLWQVAAADGVIDPYEEHMVRKIAELIYVPHHEFIAAKHRALEGHHSR